MYLLHCKKIDIYANISLILSYSEVNVATRSIPYPAQMVTAVNRSSPYPDQMVDMHLKTTSTAPTALNISGETRTPRWAPETDLQWGPSHLDSHREKTTGTSWALTIWLCCSWNKLLVRLAREVLVPRMSLVSSKVFSPFCHRWRFGSLPLSPLPCLVGDTSFLAIFFTWLHRYYLNYVYICVFFHGKVSLMVNPCLLFDRAFCQVLLAALLPTPR